MIKYVFVRVKTNKGYGMFPSSRSESVRLTNDAVSDRRAVASLGDDGALSSLSR